MGGFCGDIEVTCGEKINARCVDYEGTVNEDSSLVDERCLSIHKTTVDIYEQLDTLFGYFKFDDLGGDCITFTEKTLPVILKGLEEKICSLTSEVSESPSAFNISNLDLKCLQDPCGGDISDLTTLLQALIDKVCENG